MSRSEEFAAGHGHDRYVHETDAELSPGDVLRPAAERGQRSKGAYPDRVYFVDTHHPAYDGRGSYGRHKYAVEPLGGVLPDPEVEQSKKVYAENPDKAMDLFGRPFQESDLGGAAAARTTTHARVLRRLT